MRRNVIIFGTLKHRFTHTPAASFPSFPPFVRPASSFEVHGSVQVENRIYAHAVTTNEEAFTKKENKIKERHLKNSKLK